MCSRLSFLVSLFLFVLVVVEGGRTKTAGSSPWCTYKEQTENNHLYVSTLDGSLTAIDINTGAILWDYHSHIPLYSSTLGYMESSSKFPDLIPGLDKNLYQWNGNELTRLPFTVDELIDHTFTTTDGFIRSGARSKDDVAINVGTGKPLYKCTQFSCDRYDNESSLIGKMDRLLLTSHRTTIREAKSLNGEEIWNFTLSQMHLSLIEEEEGLGMSCMSDHDSSSSLVLHTDTFNGLLVVVDELKKKSWDFQFSSPVIKVWSQNGGKLKQVPITPFSGGSINNEIEELLPATLMLGVWQRQYYILPVNKDSSSSLQLLPSLHSSSLLIEGRSSGCHPQISFLPSLPSSLINEASNSLTVHVPDYNWLKDFYTQGPNGLALYFHPKVVENLTSESCSANENISDKEIPSQAPSVSQSNYLYQVWDYCKWITKYGLFAIIVLSVNKFRRYHMVRRKRKRMNSNSSTSSESSDAFLSDDDINEQLLDDISSLHLRSQTRRTSSTSTLKPSGTSYSFLPIVEEEDSNHAIKTERSDSTEFGGRFETEYERLGTLGKGGFGVVYHVMNKTDNREYAIKQIKLPTKKFAREKVMREVHALAQLEHPAIVRYFSSWLEQAPIGWDQREEWVSLSRVNSLIHMEEEEEEESTSMRPHPLINNTNSKSRNGIVFTNSFSDLNVSSPKLRRPASSQSQHSSSFTIEFRDDSCSRASDLTRPKTPTTCGSSNNEEERDSQPLFRTNNLNNEVGPPTFLFIQMQLCQKESMKDWLRNNIHNRQRMTILNQFNQILDAVVYVHSKGLMHRDLKPSNVFFSLDGKVKIGDFGLVTGNITPDTHRSSHMALNGLCNDGRHTTNIGTHLYVSPEQLHGLQYDQKVDVFSLGVIFFELNFPFLTEMERVKVLEELRKNKIPMEFRKHLTCETQLVEWLMSPVSKRPSASQVANSDRLQELHEIATFSDFTYIPKL